MDWKDWEPRYLEIVAELGLDRDRDMEAAMLLRHVARHVPDCTLEAERLIRGKTVIIYGPAPFTGAAQTGAVTISAGSAIGRLTAGNIWPDIIVTDLDGDMASQLEANDMGALAVIHAHGDNMDAIREWAPMFRPPLLCTTQAMPFEGVHNFGGFTDGDRAVFLALHFGAERITLRGFDLDNPVMKPGADLARKRKKLGIARRLISIAGEYQGSEIVFES